MHGSPCQQWFTVRSLQEFSESWLGQVLGEVICWGLLNRRFTYCLWNVIKYLEAWRVHRGCILLWMPTWAKRKSVQGARDLVEQVGGSTELDGTFGWSSVSLRSVSLHLSAAVRKHCRNAVQACQTILSVLAAYFFLFLLCTYYNLAVSSLCPASREGLDPRVPRFKFFFCRVSIAFPCLLLCAWRNGAAAAEGSSPAKTLCSSPSGKEGKRGFQRVWRKWYSIIAVWEMSVGVGRNDGGGLLNFCHCFLYSDASYCAFYLMLFHCHGLNDLTLIAG